MNDSDPNGLDQHAPGAKLDAGKNRLGLVLGEFSRALWAVGDIGTAGAVEYSENGWLEVPGGEARYMDAAFRHLLKHLGGELLDKKSGQPHLQHAAWNILAVVELTMRSPGVNTEKKTNA